MQTPRTYPSLNWVFLEASSIVQVGGGGNEEGLQQLKPSLLDWRKSVASGVQREITYLLKTVSLKQSGLIQSNYLKDPLGALKRED